MDPLPGKSNYFLGNDPKKWRTNVPNYAKVRYADVYPGVDLVYYGNQGQLEYDFVVAPGADPRVIKFDIRGAEKVELNAQGDLVLQADGGEIALRKPVVYQPVAPPSGRHAGETPALQLANPKSKIANPKFLDGRYTLTAKNQVRFEVPKYDSSLPLIIDPVLVYSARFSLGGSTVPHSMAVDSSGSVYLAGVTSSTQFPSTSGAFQTACTPDMQQPDSCLDAFVFKLNAEGSAVVYATFLGGSGSEKPGSTLPTIAVDASGNAYVAGDTSSMDFPTTPGAFQTSCAAAPGTPPTCADAFVTKLSPDGSALVYSTFLGGTGTDSAAGVALGSSGDVYVAGSTGSSDFPTASALQPTLGGQGNAFVAKLNATGTALLYSTYLGGSYYHRADAVAVDPQGNAYVTGSAGAHTYCVFPTCYDYSDPYCTTCMTSVAFPVDFPTTPGAWQPSCSGFYSAGSCGFLAKISTDGSQLVYSTFLGNTHAHALAVDSAGNAYFVSGHVYKLNAAGSALVYEAYNAGDSIAVDAAGNAYVAGTTQSQLITVNPIQPSLNVASPSYGDRLCSGDYRPCPDAFVAILNPEGSALLFATHFGGEARDYGTSMAIDGSGNIYLAGTTDSYEVPTTSGTLTSLPPANVFVAKIAPEDAPGVAVTPVTLRVPPEIDSSLPPQAPVTVRNMGTAPLTITDIAATQGFVANSLDCLATLSPGAACTITVGYDPQAPLGPLSGTLTIADNAADSPQVVPLSGDRTPGTYPTLSPSTLDFGQKTPGTASSPRTLTLTASQQEEMLIYSISASSDFTPTHDCPLAPTALAAGGSCTISVRFTPVVRGPRVGTLAITHATGYNPLAATLTGTALQAVAAVSPASLTFADQLIDTTSPAQTVALANAGDVPLNIETIYIYGGAVFTQNNNCPASLAPGANCIFSVTFRPRSPVRTTAELRIRHNYAPNNRSTVTLSGTGVEPLVTLSPLLLNFNSEVGGTTGPPQTITVTNSGTGPLLISSVAASGDFAVTHSCVSPVAPGASCAISVTFTPTVVGATVGTLTISSNAPGSPHLVTLSGTGVGPVVGLSANTLRFADQPLGTPSTPQTVTLGNSGNAALIIDSITASGAYAQSNDCVSPLAVGASCTISVTFAPTVVGGQSGTLIITSNAPGSPHTVALTGIGVGAVVTLSSTNLNFGNQPLGITSAPRLVNLSNSGNAPLTITSIAASGDFAQTNNCPASLATRSYCTLTFTFTPTVVGGQSGTLTIADDAAGSPHEVSLSGTGIGPVTSLSTNTLSFAGQIVGTTSAVEAVTLTNSGNAPLSISSIAATGDYALTYNCVSPLAAEASCTLSVTFTPTDAGGRAGTLIIADNAAGSPHTVALSGVGQDFSLGAFTTARAVSPGMTARFNLLLMPQGGFQQTVSLACSGAPAGATCSVSPSSVTPNGVNNVSVALEVVTTAPAASAPRDGGWRMSLPPGGWPVATTLALLGALALLAGAILRRASSSARLRLLPVLGACLLLVALVWAACGGGGGLYVPTGGTPAGTYMLTITATTSNLSHNTTVKLTVR